MMQRLWGLMTTRTKNIDVLPSGRPTLLRSSAAALAFGLRTGRVGRWLRGRATLAFSWVVMLAEGRVLENNDLPKMGVGMVGASFWKIGVGMVGRARAAKTKMVGEK